MRVRRGEGVKVDLQWRQIAILWEPCQEALVSKAWCSFRVNQYWLSFNPSLLLLLSILCSWVNQIIPFHCRLRQIVESGILDQLKKSWYQSKEGTCESHQTTAIGLSEMMAAFVMMGIAIGISHLKFWTKMCTKSWIINEFLWSVYTRGDTRASSASQPMLLPLV